jgi:hypothetical protein
VQGSYCGGGGLGRRVPGRRRAAAGPRPLLLETTGRERGGGGYRVGAGVSVQRVDGDGCSSTVGAWRLALLHESVALPYVVAYRAGDRNALAERLQSGFWLRLAFVMGEFEGDRNRQNPSEGVACLIRSASELSLCVARRVLT